MFEIRAVKGHYEVYYKGQFICSTDTEHEAKMEIEFFKTYQEAQWK